QRLALDVVDGVLAAEDEDEEQRGEEAGEEKHASGEEADERRHTADVGARAVDELVEHQGVLRLLDDLVVHVAELGGIVGELGRRERLTAEAVHGVLVDGRGRGCGHRHGKNLSVSVFTTGRSDSEKSGPPGTMRCTARPMRIEKSSGAAAACSALGVPLPWG